MIDDQELRHAGILTLTSSDSLPDIRFSGVAFVDDAIIFGENQFALHRPSDIERVEEGRFIIFYRRNGKFVARSDETGQECVFYYSDGTRWAISNSFLHITEAIRSLGVETTTHKGAAAAGYIIHSSTNQLISNDTFVNEIRLLPIGHEIEIDDALRVKPRPRKNRYSSYEEAMLGFCSKWPNRLHALMDHFGERAALDLSGGVDSRTNLALILSTEISRRAINLTTRPELAADFAVATRIAKETGLTINGIPAVRVSVEPEKAFELWKYGSLGVNFSFHLPRFDRPHQMIGINGGGGESARYFFPMLPDQHAAWLRASAPVEGEAVEATFRGALSQIGAGENSRESMRSYYQNFRARLLAGRSWIKNLTATLITPLASTDLLEAMNFLSQEEVARRQIAHDILAICQPQLLDIPFDDARKNFSVETRQNFRFQGVNVRSLGRDIAVFADPAESSRYSRQKRHGNESWLIREIEALPHSERKANAISMLDGDIRRRRAHVAVHLLSVQAFDRK